MLRFVLLALLGIPTLVHAQGTPLRVTSDVARAEIVVKGVEGARSGPAPLFLDSVSPGFYDVSLYREGRRLSGTTLQVDGQVSVRGTRVSRTVLSSLFPGLGQWRDMGAMDALVPFAAVSTMGVRGLMFHIDRAEANEEHELWTSLSAAERGFSDVAEYQKISSDLADKAWLEEQTRNDYLTLTAALHLGNILNANVRRGAYRMDLASANSLAARYSPPGKGQVFALSTLWPGLGQTRMGHEGRGMVWNLAAAATGMLLVETLRDRDEAQVDVWTLDRQILLDEGTSLPTDTDAANAEMARRAQTRADQLAASRDLESARQRRNVFVSAAVVLWALNVVDAVLLGDPEPVERTRTTGLLGRTEVAWVGDGPGLRWAWSF